MRRYLKFHIRSCLHCLLFKAKTGRQAGTLHPIPPAKRPFVLVHLDHEGPFVTTPRDNKYVLSRPKTYHVIQ